MSVKRATMRAAALDRFGGVENVHVKQLPVPEPGPDEVLLRVESAGVGVEIHSNAKANLPKCSTPYAAVKADNVSPISKKLSVEVAQLIRLAKTFPRGPRLSPSHPHSNRCAQRPVVPRSFRLTISRAQT